MYLTATVSKRSHGDHRLLVVVSGLQTSTVALSLCGWDLCNVHRVFPYKQQSTDCTITIHVGAIDGNELERKEREIERDSVEQVRAMTMEPAHERELERKEVLYPVETDP